MTLACPDGLSYLDFQDECIIYGLRRRRTLVADEPGLGKGHPLTTRVATPEGYTPVGKLKVGSQVIHPSGKPVDVMGVYDRGVLPIYRVTTNDGATTLVDADHLWNIFDDESGEFITISTLEVYGRLARNEPCVLPLIYGPVEFTSKDVPNAFLAGLTVARADLYAKPIHVDFAKYETADVAQRKSFLSGILRVLGRVKGRDDSIRVKLKRPLETAGLLHTITQIVRSLGGLVFTEHFYSRWQMDIFLPDDVLLPLVGYSRPRQNIHRRWKNFRAGVPDRCIVEITPAGQDHVRCISVNAPDNLYVTDEHIVTHNTMSAIGIANNLKKVRSMLVICLASHKIHWKRAIEKWDMNDLSVGIVTAGDDFPDTECVIINYDILHRYYDELRAGTWDIMICDEAHVLQNEESRRTLNVFGGKLRVPVGGDAEDTIEIPTKKRKSRKKMEWRHWEEIKADREVFLTGTPIPNRVKNMWTLIKRCDARGLGRNYKAFAYRYCGAFDDFHGFWDNGATNLEELNRIIKDRFMIRHLKSEVLKNLPPKVRHVVPLDSAGLQMKLQAERDAVAALLAAYEEQMGIHVDLSQESLIDLVMRARPQMFDDYAAKCDDDIGKDTPLGKLAVARKDLALAKVPMAIEYISNLIDQGLKVVVFAYHQDVIKALAERWHNSCALIYGGTPVHKRQAEADRFQEDPHCNPFIGQYTAAGTGYTLIEAYHVVCVEMTWLPYELSQAEDRCHRIGQEDTVFVHHLIVEGSMDEGMLGKIWAKQEIIDKALN